jgi:hypothetical protein
MLLNNLNHFLSVLKQMCLKKYAVQ